MHKMNQASCQLVAWPGLCCSLRGTRFLCGGKVSFHILSPCLWRPSLAGDVTASPVAARHRGRPQRQAPVHLLMDRIPLLWEHTFAWG